VVRLHLSCGLDTTPEWVVYNEFVLTTANVRYTISSGIEPTLAKFIRTVTEVRPEWLLEYAPQYFDPTTFPDNETRRALQRVINKVSGGLSCPRDQPGRNSRHLGEADSAPSQKTGKYGAGMNGNGEEKIKKKKRKAEKQ